MDDYYGSKQGMGVLQLANDYAWIHIWFLTGSNVPLGQLKAFYKLQSGKGFEEVVLDK